MSVNEIVTKINNKRKKKFFSSRNTNITKNEIIAKTEKKYNEKIKCKKTNE